MFYAQSTSTVISEVVVMVLLALVVVPDRPATAGSCGAVAPSSVLLAVGSKLAWSVCWVTVQLLG